MNFESDARATECTERQEADLNLQNRRRYQEQRASLLGARTLLASPLLLNRWMRGSLQALKKELGY